MPPLEEKGSCSYLFQVEMLHRFLGGLVNAFYSLVTGEFARRPEPTERGSAGNAAYDDNDNHHHSEEGCRGREVDGRQLLVRLQEESRFHHLDVIVERDDHVDHGDEHQQKVSSLHRRGKDQELSGESNRRRNPSQTEHAHHERHGQKRRAAVKPRQLDDRKVAAVRCHLHDHQKTSEGHGEVSQGVEERSGVAGWVHAENADEGVARMGDGRISQQALEVLLNQGHQVPVGHREDGERDEHMGQGCVAVAHGHQADEHGHGRYLCGGGHKGRHLVRGPLVDAGCPDVEWKEGQLEEEAAQGEQQPDEGHGGVEQGRAASRPVR